MVAMVQPNSISLAELSARIRNVVHGPSYYEYPVQGALFGMDVSEFLWARLYRVKSLCLAA